MTWSVEYPRRLTADRPAKGRDSLDGEENSGQEGGLQAGSLQEGSLQEGSLQEGSLQEGSLQEGSLQEGSLQEGAGAGRCCAEEATRLRDLVRERVSALRAEGREERPHEGGG